MGGCENAILIPKMPIGNNHHSALGNRWQGGQKAIKNEGI
jgi:hypothetical protein